MPGTPSIDQAVQRLCRLYSQSFGGKDNGRYRIAVKLVRQLLSRRRLYDEDVQALTRAMLEEGYVLIDMDSFFVIMSASTFNNYRRASEDCLEQVQL